MFKHPYDRPPETEPATSLGGKVRAFLRNVDWEDVFVFVHITLAFTFVVWGLEIILPFTVWRVLVGLYIGLWVGADLLKALWGKGIYFLRSVGDMDE